MTSFAQLLKLSNRFPAIPKPFVPKKEKNLQPPKVFFNQ